MQLTYMDYAGKNLFFSQACSFVVHYQQTGLTLKFNRVKFELVGKQEKEMIA